MPDTRSIPRDVAATSSHQTHLRTMSPSDAAREILLGNFKPSEAGLDLMWKRGYTFPRPKTESKTGASEVTTTTPKSTDRVTNRDSNATASNASTVPATHASTTHASTAKPEQKR